MAVVFVDAIRRVEIRKFIGPLLVEVGRKPKGEKTLLTAFSFLFKRMSLALTARYSFRRLDSKTVAREQLIIFYTALGQQIR
jgi:hypothetical protein